MTNVTIVDRFGRFVSMSGLYALAAIPLAPCAYVLLSRGAECFEHDGGIGALAGCWGWFVLHAPFVGTEGDIFPGDQPLWMHRLETLATALVVGCTIALTSIVWRPRRSDLTTFGGRKGGLYDTGRESTMVDQGISREFALRFVAGPILLAIELCLLLFLYGLVSSDGQSTHHEFNMLVAISLILGQFFGLCHVLSRLLLPHHCLPWVRFMTTVAMASVAAALVSTFAIGLGAISLVFSVPLWAGLFTVCAVNLRLAAGLIGTPAKAVASATP